MVINSLLLRYLSSPASIRMAKPSIRIGLLHCLMDGIVFKVRQAGKVINKTIYLAVGLNREGYKEILGMWLGENESAAFWQGVMTDLKVRGVEDILVSVIDNLHGFTQAISNIFPQKTRKLV